MRSLRLGREYDAVLVHDAVDYLTTESDLRQAMETAYLHLRPGGVAIFAPDNLRENFTAGTDSDGYDDEQGRGLRYLEWTWDPDPSDSLYVAEFTYLLHETGQPTRCVFDQHVCGLFPRSTWQTLLAEVGFEASIRPLEHSEVPPGEVEIFVARIPGGLG
jgi:hypothetical protein